MPKSTKKFLEPDSYDHLIGEAETGAKVGEIRVKPSSILWKPKGAQKWHSATLEDFSTWMETKKLVKK